MPGPYEREWYEVVDDDSLRQGDVLRQLTAFWFTPDLDPEQVEPPSGYDVLDVIVATPSCDLHQRRVDNVIVMRVFESTPAHLRAQNEDQYPVYFEVHRQGLVSHRFMLPDTALTEPAFPFSIVEGRQLFALPFLYVQRHASSSPHLRLRPPLREKFGNWVGGRFSDVGPEDAAGIPREARIFPPHIIRVAEQNP